MPGQSAQYSPGAGSKGPRGNFPKPTDKGTRTSVNIEAQRDRRRATLRTSRLPFREHTTPDVNRNDVLRVSAASNAKRKTWRLGSKGTRNSTTRTQRFVQRVAKFFSPGDAALLPPMDVALLQNESENADLRSQITKLERSLAASERLCEGLRRRNHALQSAWDAHDDALGAQLMDEQVVARVKDILEQIRTWARRFGSSVVGTHVVTPSSELGEMLKLLPRLQSVEELQLFLEAGADMRQRRRKVAASWVAFRVVAVLFQMAGDGERQGLDLWLPEAVRDGVGKLELEMCRGGDNAPTPIPTLHEWRALTLSILDSKYPANTVSEETLSLLKSEAHRIVKVLSPFAGPLTSSETRALETKLVANVLQPALGLARDLRRQRAAWSLRYPEVLTETIVLKSGEKVVLAPLDPDTMSDVERDILDWEDEVVLRNVDIVLTPILYKMGNAEGEKFDTEVPIIKAEVSCISYQGI